MESITTQTTTEVIDKGRWQWRSNPNPFLKSEEPQWEFYSLDDNYLIEKAYYDQQEKVELKDYEISIKHMRQMKKGDIIKQRPVRRIDWKGCIEEMDRSERYLETEKPKTINKIFGRLGDFLVFFSKRSPEILEFTSQLENIEKESDINSLNKDIIPKLVCCFEELVKPVLEQTQDSSISELKKKILLQTKERHEKLILLLKKEIRSFEEFYGEILRAYTMSTCLYENLNSYLRNESWSEMENLLPYAFCLCKAFFHFRSQTNLPQGNMAMKSMMVYRGTAFDESALNCYHLNNFEKHFSWNSVTSTSTNKKVAENFMYQSVDLKNEKYPVLFMIEIPILKDNVDSEYLEWMNLCQYSAKSEEDEVILAPGSVFEIMEIAKDKDKRTTIKLKLKDEIKSLAHGGLIMQGALQSQMMTEKKLKIVCLEGEELVETLKCLTGNKLIEEVEFCLCKFDNRSSEAMIEVVSSLERSRELKFLSCLYQDKEKFPSDKWKQFKRWSIQKVEVSGMNNDLIQLFMIKNEDDKQWMPLSQFDVNFFGVSHRKCSEFIQMLEHLTQITSLAIHFDKDWIPALSKTKMLAKGFKYLTQLTSLVLDFSHCSDFSDHAIFVLAQGFQYLTKLTSLTLNFPPSRFVTSEGVCKLSSQVLSDLSQLKLAYSDTKILRFESQSNQVHQMPQQSIPFLKRSPLVLSRVLESQKQLISSKKLTSEDFKKNIQMLPQQFDFFLFPSISLGEVFQTANTIIKGEVATVPILGFIPSRRGPPYFYPNSVADGYISEATSSDCPSAAYSKMESFIPDGLHLDYLNFKFCDYHQVKSSPQNLTAQGLRLLLQFSSWTLKFCGCHKLTGQSVNYPKPRELAILQEFLSLTLRPCPCHVITDQGMKYLRYHGLRHLTRLSSLELYFSECGDEDINSLVSQVLVDLTYLRSLTLCVGKGLKMTDEGLRSLASGGLQHLVILKKLDLYFCQCHEITNEGLNHLASQGLQRLKFLNSLNIKFCCSQKLTNEGLNNLISQGIRHLTQLTSLTLDFEYCAQITEFTLSNISKALHYFGFQIEKKET